MINSPSPLQIKRVPPDQGGGLEIIWNDGSQSQITAKRLRESCPCAECQEIRGSSTHQKPLSPQRETGSENKPKSSLLKVVSATIDESLTLNEIWGIGNYALGLRWQDKHDSGIYSYALLRELADASL